MDKYTKNAPSQWRYRQYEKEREEAENRYRPADIPSRRNFTLLVIGAAVLGIYLGWHLSHYITHLLRLAVSR